ncbi:MAG: hypothetical protein AB1758_06425 [Candidatus Eremiobacterota bacterium]
MTELRFLPGQNYDCVQCAKGCRHTWRIHTDPHTESRIRESGLALRVIQETGVPGVFDENPEGGSKLLARHEGHCVFLRPDNLCAVHAELGYDSKPVGCREFPFQIVNTPDGLHVGITFYCTAAKQNHGRAMEVHAQDIHDLLKLFRPPGTGFAPMKLTPVSAATLEWPVYRRLEKLVEEEVERTGGSARAVWALAELGGSLSGPIPVEALETAFERARPELLCRDDVLSMQEQFYVAAVLCTLEVQENAARQGVTQNFLAGELVTLPHTRWQGTLSGLEGVAAPDWLRDELVRYQKALLFRKFLPQKRPILDNLVALHLMPRLFRLYAAMAAQVRKTSAIEREDVDYALDQLELFLTHTTSEGVDRLLSAFAQAYLEQIPAALQGGAA